MAMSVSLMSCKKIKDGYVADGELVVIQDVSDITLGVYGVDTLNPVATKSKSVQKIMNIVYEPLFTIDEEGKAVGVLASSYSVSDGGKKITVTIKDGVKWHDGTNFTSEDVAYTLSRMRDAGGLYGKLSEKIHSFTATDKKTIVINFEKKEPSPVYLLTFPVVHRSDTYSENADFTPEGTGSYKFVSRSGTEIVLEPNPQWHGGSISKRKIIVKILKDKNAVAEAFNVGEIDAITSDEISGGTVTTKSNSESKTVVSERMVFLGFNTQSPVVSSPAVRKAINGVLDRTKIVEQDAYGRGVPAELSIDPTSRFLPDESKGDKVENYSEDIMKKSGYIIKDGIYHKDDLPFSARLLVNADNAERTALADSIATSLKTAGFDIVVEKTSYEEYGVKIAEDDFDIFIGETEVSKNPNPAALLTGEENYFNFDAGKINSFMSKYCDVDDTDEIRKKIKEFKTLFYNDPPYLPIYFKTESVIYGSYVSGIVTPVVFDPYKEIEKWYFYDKDGKESKGRQDE